MLLRGLTGVLVAALFTSCAPRSLAPSVRPFPNQLIQPVPHVRGIVTYSTALASIAGVFERTFRVQPAPASVEFYSGDRAMQAALEAIGYDPAFARDAGSRLAAVAAHRRVFVNESRLAGESWTSRTSTLAHELVHCLQFDLAGGRRGSSEQWLREGFAEWMAIRVVEELGGVERGLTLRLMREEARLARTQVTLADLGTFQQWVALAGRPDTAVYAYATLATDQLVARHGVDAVLAYFERFSTADDASNNFRAVFGRDRVDFQADVAREFAAR